MHGTVLHVKPQFLTIHDVELDNCCDMATLSPQAGGPGTGRPAAKMSGRRLNPGTSFTIADYPNMRPYQGIPNVYLQHPGNR
jgi:hypothetical protein